MSKLSSWKAMFFLCVFCAVTASASLATTFNTLLNLSGSNGANPEGSLVQARDGNFYGTTSTGGDNNYGTVFKITPAGTLTTLHSFDSTDGSLPVAGLVLATDGNFYGTTRRGGASSACAGGCGTVFSITPSGTLTTLHSFCSETNCTDGTEPFGSLVQGTDGDFYGTTYLGGLNVPSPGNGTVFKITRTGTLTTLYRFCPETNCPDGAQPWAGVVQGTDGNFYGTTNIGGAFGEGTIFKIAPGGKLTTLYSFCAQAACTDGASPEAGLVQGSDGNFYGTTNSGGTSDIFGTVFKITPAGKYTTLYSFCSKVGCTDGSLPAAGLVQGTNGNFYGTTGSGGTSSACPGGCGTVFKITATGTLTTLHSFKDTDGTEPFGSLVQGTDGSFYATTYLGGANNDGTAFSLSLGLGPFVEALTYRGKVGNRIEFLGQGFTSSTTVSFNGTKSPSVKVVSGSYLTATVPSGATTGFVTVTTSSGTLKSNQTFRVIPQIASFDPTSGPDGTAVTINGESLTGATSVAFGGVNATSFKVDSYTQITAAVPSGAKTGRITVTTPGDTATSAGTFTVP